MKIELLIAARGGEPPRVLGDERIGRSIAAFVANQYDEDADRLEPASSPASEWMRIQNFREQGVARNRNRALEQASGELCVLFDDDTELHDGFIDVVERAFARYPEADILTFRIRTPDGRSYKRYPNFSFRHNRISVLGVSEVEIAFRKSSVIDARLRFDERFGLGSAFPSGEGNVFLVDALEAGLHARFVPQDVVIHEWESSGKRFEIKEMIYSKGALFRRMYGRWIGRLVALLFLVLKYPRYSRFVSARMAFQLVRQGESDFNASESGVCFSERGTSSRGDE